MKTFYDHIEDQAAGIFAIWCGLNAAVAKDDNGDVDDFRIRGLLDLLGNAGERLEMLARDRRKISHILNAEQKTSCHGTCHAEK